LACGSITPVSYRPSIAIVARSMPCDLQQPRRQRYPGDDARRQEEGRYNANGGRHTKDYCIL
ncbi:unnamed protein product, partial [Closterium sp. NIES-65]